MPGFPSFESGEPQRVSDDPVIPDDLTTKLAAVNVLLQSISESPVASLDTSLSVDVAAAVQAIDEMDRKIQTKGWHFNREDALTLSPSEDGTISLPANCVWVSNAYWTSTGLAVRVAQRGNSLYDRDNHTYLFTQEVTVDMVQKLTWEEMPEYARQAITEAAVDVFQVRLQGSSIIKATSEKAVQGAMALLEQREDEADEQNNIGGNAFVGNTLYGGPRRRLR
jgi:hypothetical protein